MLQVDHAPALLAHAADLPGTRCDPDDDIWPCPYVLLSEGEAARELHDVGKAESVVLGTGGPRVDSINFQPCAYARSQDRSVAQTLDVHGEKWTFSGVFDGHLGHDTVEHTAFHLPIIVKQFLCKLSAQARSKISIVEDVLRRSISTFDDAIAGDVINLFPGGLDELLNLPDDQISAVINDDGVNFKKTRLCMYGTTALVVLVNPSREHVWVANLGDCQVVLLPSGQPKYGSTDVLSVIHNGTNPDEVTRVMSEHPGESECVTDDRVLGVIAPFRCIGDVPFKMPPAFTRKVLYNLHPGYHASSPWEEFLVRNLTPPYISNAAEVTYRRLAPGGTGSNFLVLCTDGMLDLYGATSVHVVAEDWARILRGMARSGGRAPDENMAARLLHHALGGSDVHKVSRALTLDADSPWFDDTTIVVMAL